MAYKLRSRVAVYQYKSVLGGDGEWVEHVVLVRDKTFRPGKVIRAKGYLLADKETKAPPTPIKVRIKNVDDCKLKIGWSADRFARFPPCHFDSTGFFDPKRINGDKERTKFDSSDRSIDPRSLPEAFSLLDKLRMRLLTGLVLRRVEGITQVRRETEIVYEPTLPPQSRK